MLPLLMLRMRDGDRRSGAGERTSGAERSYSRPVVEIEEILKEAGGIKKEEDMQIDVNRILIADIN